MKRKLTPFFVTVALFGIIFWIGHSISQQQMQELVHQAGIFGPIIFIVITLLTYVIAPISGTPVMYAGYYAFGRDAIFYTQAATLMSFAVNYWIARTLGRPFIEHVLGHETRKRLDIFIDRYGHVSLYAVRVLLSNFHDYLSYAAGLTKMRFGHYFLVSFIALAQETVLWYFLSERVSTPEEFTAWTFAIGLFLCGLFLIGRLLYMRLILPRKQRLSASVSARILGVTFALLLLVLIGTIITALQGAPGDRPEISARIAPENQKSTEEWRTILTPEQFHILREGGTERPYTGTLLHNTQKGTYYSAGCNKPLFRSEKKYDSGTGWPSFTEPIRPDAIILREDDTLGIPRTEVLDPCGGHLGHVFDDGPEPTGKRYCMNSAALIFIPDEAY